MRQVGTGVQSVIRSLGWMSFVLLILVVVGLVAWWRWDQSRQLPLPPQAQNVSSQILGPLAKQTSFVVPTSAADVRAFYRTALTQRGWTYCGTQATPGCSNLGTSNNGAGDQVDVYRHDSDARKTGQTIEVWPAEHPGSGTSVAVFEANPAR